MSTIHTAVVNGRMSLRLCNLCVKVWFRLKSGMHGFHEHGNLWFFHRTIRWNK